MERELPVGLDIFVNHNVYIYIRIYIDIHRVYMYNIYINAGCGVP